METTAERKTAMGLYEDFTTFLEQRLEEFLRTHPELELQVLDENLREQEEDTQRLMSQLQSEQKQMEADILSTAQEIQRWHSRIEKARSAGRVDLAEAAQQREAALLRQGNQRWGQMQVLRERIQQTQTLMDNIRTRRQEVQKQRAQTQPTGNTSADRNPTGWYQTGFSSQTDPLEDQFRRWETDAELEELKRSMGR